MFAALSCAALLLSPAEEPKKTYPRPELLVEPAELQKMLDDPAVRVLDARPAEQYKAGHVPGARWVDHATWSREFAGSQDAKDWAKRLGEPGIGAETRVVVYDDNRSKDAARIWWILRYWGVRDARLLNGGWGGWKASGGKVSTAAPGAPKETKRELKPEASRLATKDELLKSLKEKPPQIIDARSEGEFCGTETTAKRNGAIPGALHVEWSDALDKRTGRFKSAEELTKLFRAAGVDPAKPSVTYCQSGGRAAVLAFALELMGGTEVRNYYRSWSEWGNAADTPVVKPGK